MLSRSQYYFFLSLLQIGSDKVCQNKLSLSPIEKNIWNLSEVKVKIYLLLHTRQARENAMSFLRKIQAINIICTCMKIIYTDKHKKLNSLYFDWIKLSNQL